MSSCTEFIFLRYPAGIRGNAHRPLPNSYVVADDKYPVIRALRERSQSDFLIRSYDLRRYQIPVFPET